MFDKFKCGDLVKFTLGKQLENRVIASVKFNKNKKNGLPSSLQLFFAEGDGIEIKFSEVVLYVSKDGSYSLKKVENNLIEKIDDESN